jgi:hypothetical protein
MDNAIAGLFVAQNWQNSTKHTLSNLFTCHSIFKCFISDCFCEPLSIIGFITV